MQSIRGLLFHVQKVVTFVGFIAIGYWGHATHWRFVQSHAEDGTLHSPSDEAALAASPESMAKPLKCSAEGMVRHGIELQPAQCKDIQDVVESLATVTYNEQRYSELSTCAAGHVRQVFVRVGQAVKKDQVLAIVDSSEVGEAKAMWLQKLVAAQYQRNSLDKFKQSGDGAIPTSRIRAVEAELNEAELEANIALQKLLNFGFTINMKMDLSRPPSQLAESVRSLGIPPEILEQFPQLASSANLIAIRAPFDGVVVAQHAVMGETVSAENCQFVVADLSTMWVKLAVRREDARKLSIGQPLQFTADGLTAPVHSTLAWISPEIDLETQMFMAGCEIPNTPISDLQPSKQSISSPQYHLQANQFGRAIIQVAQRPKAVVIPASAIQRMPDQSAVAFVREADAAYFIPRQLRLGTIQAGEAEVLEGVLPGEQVVTEGSFILKSELMRSALVGS